MASQKELYLISYGNCECGYVAQLTIEEVKKFIKSGLLIQPFTITDTSIIEEMAKENQARNNVLKYVCECRKKGEEGERD